MIDEVTHKKWVNVGRCAMETVIKCPDDFIDEFLELLKKLTTHFFVTAPQKQYYSGMKENLNEGLVAC